jgi:hypothetical protein
MASPWDVQEQIVRQIANWPDLAPGSPALGGWWAGFGDITLREFPYCDDWPACHVNIMELVDEPGRPGFPLNGLRLQVGVYVSLQEPDLDASNERLWKLVMATRAAITSDRTLGGLLNEKLLMRNVRQVPSPLGTPIVGTRRIEFEAVIVENLL